MPLFTYDGSIESLGGIILMEFLSFDGILVENFEDELS